MSNNRMIFILKINMYIENIVICFRSLLYHESADVLIVVTESLVVGQFKVEGDGGLSEISKVKMSTR